LEQGEKLKAGVRTKVDHPFRVIKRRFGHSKVSYRGLAKDTEQLMTLIALSNIWMARKVLLQRVQACVRLQTGKGPPFGGNIAGHGRN
jgi:IS5 family transposase